MKCMSRELLLYLALFLVGRKRGNMKGYLDVAFLRDWFLYLIKKPLLTLLVHVTGFRRVFMHLA